MRDISTLTYCFRYYNARAFIHFCSRPGKKSCFLGGGEQHVGESVWLWVRRYLDTEANLAAVNYKDEVRARQREGGLGLRKKKKVEHEDSFSFSFKLPGQFTRWGKRLEFGSLTISLWFRDITLHVVGFYQW